MRKRLLALAVVGLVASLAACAGREPAATMNTTPGRSSTIPPTATASPVGEPVDLVYISDSAGSGVAQRYAELATEALDRDVRVHDHVTGGARITQLRDTIRTSIADEVAEAEIIVVYGNPEGLEPDQLPNIVTCLEAAGDPASDWAPPVVPSVEDWQGYRDVLDQIWSEIWALRENRPTVLRTHDFWNPFISVWREAGIEPECTANWEVQSRVIREAAEANGVVFVPIFDAFNGPRHDEDPREKGWIGDDGAHASEGGMTAIADALAAVGFDTSVPPGS